MRYNFSHVPRTATLRDTTQGASGAWAQSVALREHAGRQRSSAWAREGHGHPPRPSLTLHGECASERR